MLTARLKPCPSRSCSHIVLGWPLDGASPVSTRVFPQAMKAWPDTTLFDVRVRLILYSSLLVEETGDYGGQDRASPHVEHPAEG